MTIPALTTTLILASAALAFRNWRLSRAEQERAEARIEALSSAMDDPSAELRSNSSRPDPSAAVEGQTLPGVEGQTLPGLGLDVKGMSAFEPEMRPRHSHLMVGVAAGLALVAVSAAFVFTTMRSPSTARPDIPVVATSTLELLSTQHVIDGDALVITGLVRNGSDHSASALAVIASAVGHDGEVTGRATAAIEPTVLAAGKETSFRVTVRGVGDLSRYRLGFTTGGHPVPHVDLRADVTRTAMASTGEN